MKWTRMKYVLRIKLIFSSRSHIFFETALITFNNNVLKFLQRTLFPWETAVTTDEVDISRDLHKKTKRTVFDIFLNRMKQQFRATNLQIS